MPEEKKLGEFEKKEGVKHRFPVFSCKAGFVQGSVWENERAKGDRRFSVFSVKVVKRYQDGEGNWRETNSFNLDELPRLELVARKCFEFLALKQEVRGK